MSLYKQAVV